MAGIPLVYIIVLNWNGKDDTLECLRSIRHISYTNYKIILVDNASGDGTVDSVRSEFPDVQIIVNASNLRYAGGNNVGIRSALAQGAQYILLLNNDTTVDPHFLTELTEAMNRESTAGMAGPKIYYYDDPKRIWFAGGKIDWWRGWFSHVGIREIDRGQHDTVRETDFITGCCLMVRREVIEKVGMLDEAYYIYGEDADWCIRAVYAGYKLLYVPKGKIWHKLSVASGGHLSWFKNWNKLKSQLRLMARYAKVYHWLTIPVGMAIKIPQSFFRSNKFESVHRSADN